MTNKKVTIFFSRLINFLRNKFNSLFVEVNQNISAKDQIKNRVARRGWFDQVMVFENYFVL